MHESLDSVLGQSFEDFELICVDAASTDNTLSILKEYSSKDRRIKTYHSMYTPIPATTKNYGIDRSNGEYVVLLDADDYLSPEVLSNMYDRAKQTNADVVIPDLLVVSEDGKTVHQRKIGLRGQRNAILNGREAVTESLDWTIHAFGLWSGDLIRKFRFEEFGTYSDEYSGRLLFFNCNKVAFSKGSYFYRTNPQSITRKVSLKMYDRPFALYRLALFLDQNGFDEKDVCSYLFSTFKDCCYLININKKLDVSERVAAEKKIKNVYDLINRDKVRKGIFMAEPGKAEIWKVNGRYKKYFYAMLTYLNWRLVKELSSKVFLW